MEDRFEQFTRFLAGGANPEAAPAAAGKDEVRIPRSAPAPVGAPLRLPGVAQHASPSSAQQGDGDTATAIASASAMTTLVDPTGYSFDVPSALVGSKVETTRAEAFERFMAIRRQDPRAARRIDMEAGLASAFPRAVIDGVLYPKGDPEAKRAYPTDNMLIKLCALYRIGLDVPGMPRKSTNSADYEGWGFAYAGPDQEPGASVAAAGDDEPVPETLQEEIAPETPIEEVAMDIVPQTGAGTMSEAAGGEAAADPQVLPAAAARPRTGAVEAIRRLREETAQATARADAAEKAVEAAVGEKTRLEAELAEMRARAEAAEGELSAIQQELL